VRNNSDRLGAVTGGQDAPIQQPEQPVQNSQPAQAQTLQFVVPTEFVELPSRGLYYPEGHPLHNVDTIEIRFMTAKDEDILSSAALLKKGIAIDRFLQNIIVDRTIKVSDMLVGDKNAIVIASRISGYGAEYEAGINCPSCGSSTHFTFDLRQCEMTPQEAHREQGLQKTEDNTFIIHLDRSNVDAEVRLLTSRDEASLIQVAEKRRRKKLPQSTLTDQLRKIIVSVGGNRDPHYINSFIQHMPAFDSKMMRRRYQKIVPNIDMEQTFVCSECDFEGEVSVPFGANFFWPK
tara:strand:- start:47 stop:919 length:873 start_codon:yes stop_codon:yes gene_type:complete